jgi:fructose transport system permease protein
VTDSVAAASEADFERLAPRLTPLTRIQRQLHAHPALGPFVVLGVSAIVFSLLNSRFGSSANASLMLQQVAVIATLGVAQTLIILTAGIDLSIGAAMILAQLYMAQMAANNHVAGLLALLIGFVVGLATGVLNATLVTVFSPAAVHRHARHARHLRVDRLAVLEGLDDPVTADTSHPQLDR